MKRGTKILLIVLAAIVIVVLIGYSSIKGMYNTMVQQETAVDAAWADVENNLQRRLDLIPNLVNTVKGFAEQERDVLLGVTEARSRVAGAGSREERIDAEQELGGALSRLLLVVENYPQLKSNQNFLALQDELAGTENRIAVSRKRYNDSVRQFNTYIRQFPNNLFANMFGFEQREFFEAPEGAEEAPQVEF